MMAMFDGHGIQGNQSTAASSAAQVYPQDITNQSTGMKLQTGPTSNQNIQYSSMTVNQPIPSQIPPGSGTGSSPIVVQGQQVTHRGTSQPFATPHGALDQKYVPAQPQQNYPQPLPTHGSPSHAQHQHIYTGGAPTSTNQSQVTPQQIPSHSPALPGQSMGYTNSGVLSTAPGNGINQGKGNVFSPQNQASQYGQQSMNINYSQGVSSQASSNIHMHYAQPHVPVQVSSIPYPNQGTVPGSSQGNASGGQAPCGIGPTGQHQPMSSQNTPANSMAQGQGLISQANYTVHPHNPSYTAANVGPGQIPNNQSAPAPASSFSPGQAPRQGVPSMQPGQFIQAGHIQNLPQGQSSQFPVAPVTSQAQPQPIEQNYAPNMYNQQVGPGSREQPQIHPASVQSVSGHPSQVGQYSYGNQVIQQNQMAVTVRTSIPQPQLQKDIGPHGHPIGQAQPPGMRYPVQGQVLHGNQNVRAVSSCPQPQAAQPTIPQQTQQNLRPTLGPGVAPSQVVSAQQYQTQYMARPQTGGQVYMQPNQQPPGVLQSQGQASNQPALQRQPMVSQGYQMPPQGQILGQGQRPVINPQNQGQANVMNGQGQTIQFGQVRNISPDQNQNLYSSNTHSPQHQPMKSPLNPVTNYTHSGSGQDIRSQIQEFGTPQPASLPPGILQPSSVPISPIATPSSNTPTDTPHPTPSQTPQPSMGSQQAFTQPEHQPSPQRQLPPTHTSQTAAGMPAVQPNNQTAVHSNQNSPLKHPVLRNNNMPIRRQDSGASNASSLDDILSSSPGNAQMSPSKETVLRPRVVTEEEQAKQREEQMKTSLTMHRDPYTGMYIDCSSIVNRSYHG